MADAGLRTAVRALAELYQPLVQALAGTYAHFYWPIVNTIVLDNYDKCYFFAHQHAAAACRQHSRWNELVTAHEPADAYVVAGEIAMAQVEPLRAGLEDHFRRTYTNWPQATDERQRQEVAYMACLALDVPAHAVLGELIAGTWVPHLTWSVDELSPGFNEIFRLLALEVLEPYVQYALDSEEGSPASISSGKPPADERRRRQRWMLYGTLVTSAGEGSAEKVETRAWLLLKIADQVDFKFHPENQQHERARRALQVRAGGQASGARFDGVKRVILADAAAVVLGRWDERQRHRFGKGEGSRTAEITPSELHWEDGWWWVVNETRKAAIADLLNEPYPASGSAEHAQKQSGLLAKLIEVEASGEAQFGRDDDDPLVVLARSDQVKEVEAQLLALAESLPPSERALLNALREQGESDERGAISAAAEQLGIKPGTARERLSSIRKRVRRKT